MGFLYGWHERLFVSELNKKHFTRQVFSNSFFSGSLLQLLLEHCNFLNTDISQGSVATYLRCSGMFRYEFVANLPLSLPEKEFLKTS